MKKQETLDTLMDSITIGVYVKSFRIDLLGTVDDTSHEITYTRYKKTGVLKVTDSTYPVSYRYDDIELYEISATKLVIKNTEVFDKDVYDFLRDCQITQTYPRHICDGALYVIKVELSNGKKYAFAVEFEELYTITENFYEFLSNYQNERKTN